MKKLSEVAKRDIQDLFTCGVTLPGGETKTINWAGRYDDVDFLARLYNLEDLPSYDHRYRTAEGDIRCHTNFRDWEDDWVFSDDRFQLKSGEDEFFLRFLCEVFHPAVTQHSVEDEAQPEYYYFRQISGVLRSEGYELYETKRLANKPVFDWRLVGGPTAVIEKQTEAIKEYFTSDHLRQQIEIMQKSVESNPTEAIGKAKELVESCCRTILERYGQAANENAEIPELMKETVKVLGSAFVPDSVNDQRVDEAMAVIVGNLSQVATRLAFLRNKMGTGHGRSDSFSGLQPRHARLTVGAASTLCWFLWETYEVTVEKEGG